MSSTSFNEIPERYIQKVLTVNLEQAFDHVRSCWVNENADRFEDPDDFDETEAAYDTSATYQLIRDNLAELTQ
jgi:hypothetical protein